MLRSWEIARALAFFFVAILTIGFILFAMRVSGYEQDAGAEPADAIIVLTGDAGRLAAGAQLLRDGRAGHLLISGVHPSATSADLQDQTGLSEADFDCCVTLGRQATDTIGNAREADELVNARDFDRLIIVTSDYHLPRSLMEMKALMPGVEFIPYPVHTTPPWRNARAARLWLLEYAKYTTVQMRYALMPRTDNA
ncbi:YdcF family protein [Maricaulis parjimensis]|uniref:YdcF family protein n=1 Tax=Maricaulis parjimensis TaxID=144023 RepID=UPI00193966D3|nr:YdcF family protein [Maricaulis parjimensis]